MDGTKLSKRSGQRLAAENTHSGGSSLGSGRVAGSLLVGLYALSGLASLAYEVLWARVLALQFGVSIFGVVAVVVAFMGGLGGGSLLGVWLAKRIARPLRIFALLEAGIAVFALAMPWAFAAADDSLTALAGRTSLLQWYLLLGTASILFLALPALAMGVGFPLVLEAAREKGVTPDRVYGWNTVGGAVGAMLPLALLPAFGWLTSTQIVAAIGLLVAAGALHLSSAPTASPTPAPTTPATHLPLGTLLAYAGVGAASLTLEIGWTRLYGMVLLRTEYVLGILLAVFLVGIGVGSLLMRHFDHPLTFDIVPVAASISALLSLHLLPAISDWGSGANFGGLTRALLLQGGLLAVATLPVTLLLGMWLPLLAVRLGGGSRTAAKLYAANSVGAAIGALMAGTVLIPLIGTAATTALAAAALLCFGVIWMQTRWRWPILAIVLVAAWFSRELPPVRELLPRSMAGSRDLYVHEDAVTITHVVEVLNGQRVLLDDLQRIDASSEQSDVEGQKGQARLPLLLHRNPRSVLFLGFGTGISAAGSLHFPALERHAVEISSGAIDAAREWFASSNGAVSERTTIVRDDAVRFLRADTARYDVIVGDLFHPDLAGRSALLSRQQFQRVRARLAPGGVFVQWLALPQFERESLEVVLRTFAGEFPSATMFVDGFRLGLVGSDVPPSAAAVLENVGRMSEVDVALATGGEGPWTTLGRYWGAIDVGSGPIQDEWAPQIEFRLARAWHRGELDFDAIRDYMLGRRPAVEAAAQALGVSAGDVPRFERAYNATTIAQRSGLLALEPSATPQSYQMILQAYGLNPDDRWINLTLADFMIAAVPAAVARGADAVASLEAILRVRPDYAPALRELWRLSAEGGRAEAARDYLSRLRRVSPFEPAAMPDDPMP